MRSCTKIPFKCTKGLSNFFSPAFLCPVGGLLLSPLNCSSKQKRTWHILVRGIIWGERHYLWNMVAWHLHISSDFQCVGHIYVWNVTLPPGSALPLCSAPLIFADYLRHEGSGSVMEDGGRIEKNELWQPTGEQGDISSECSMNRSHSLYKQGHGS